MSDNPPTILWVKYVFNGNVKEVNSAEADVKTIMFGGPGMYEVHRDHGIVDFIVSDNTEHRAKIDQIKKPDKSIVIPS